MTLSKNQKSDVTTDEVERRKSPKSPIERLRTPSSTDTNFTAAMNFFHKKNSGVFQPINDTELVGDSKPTTPSPH